MSIANKIILHLLIVACSPVFVVVASTRCFSCDLSTSDVSYEDAEKRCNSRGPIDCPNAQYKACMTEAFLTRKESLSPASSSSSSSSSSSAPPPSFNVMKKCLVDCPVFVNSTAEHIRCCLETGCNNLIFIETEDSTARPPPSRNLPPEDVQRRPGGGQSLPTIDNQDPSMARPNGPGRFPPGPPEEAGGKRPQHPGAPGGPGGMRPPQSDMGDASQKNGANANGATGGGSNLSSGRGNAGASSGVKSESSPLLALPSIFHVFLLVGISSFACIIQT